LGLKVRIDPELSLRTVFESLFAGSRASLAEEEEAWPEKLEAAVADVEGWLSIKLTDGKCSRLLKEQLARHSVALGEVYSGLRYYYEPYNIYTVIENIENGRQVSDKPFTAGLRGLYHAHHSMAFFMAENALRNWNRKVRESGLPEHDYMEKRASELLMQRMETGMPQETAAKDLLKEIAYVELMAGIEGPQPKTGEWLIYAKHAGINYYLALAFHTEGDDNILKRMRPCFQEFEFLRNIVSLRKNVDDEVAV
jgi:hypothetical protein